MSSRLGNSWDEKLESEFSQEYFKDIRKFLAQEYSNFKVYPPMKEILSAFEHTPYENVKVVILGQDPYHGYG
ncbi:MAG: uracil-DNA glycosylase, partial [Clostridia bacterium]|nr:uracil-DNA glycosylase [Clostridia bacterium]